MTDLKEHDVVVLKSKMGEVGKGTKGVIVYDYGHDCFEVEFCVNGKSVLKEVSKCNLKLNTI